MGFDFIGFFFVVPTAHWMHIESAERAEIVCAFRRSHRFYENENQAKHNILLKTKRFDGN